MTIDTYAANEAMRTYAQATHGMPAPSTEGTITEQAHNAVTHTQKMFERYVDRIDANKFSSDGLQDVIAQFTNTDAAKGFETAVTRVEQNLDQAATRVEHLRRELSPAGDTATELRNTRYWDSTVRILDNVQDTARLSAVAAELIAKADRAQLGVLLAQLGPYMQARVETLANITPETRRGILDGYTTAIEAATDRAVPEYSKAKRRLVNAEKVAQEMRWNADVMRKLIASPPGSYRPVFIDPRQYDPDQ